MMKDKSSSFMSKYSVVVFASILALILAGFMMYRIGEQKRVFDKAVRDALRVSGGYDQQFADMIISLENILAERASFGYAGSKDPMTGTTRAVAVRQPDAGRKITALPRRSAPAPSGEEVLGEAPPRVMVEADPVRLTAIIFDNTRNIYTAIVMDGTRSLSVDVGDRVVGRRITRITNDEIHMEDERERFIYNIMGGNTRIAK